MQVKDENYDDRDGEVGQDGEAGEDGEVGQDGEDKEMDDKERMRDLAPVSLWQEGGMREGERGTCYNFRPCTLCCFHLYPPQRTQLKCSPLMPTAMRSN